MYLSIAQCYTLKYICMIPTIIHYCWFGGKPKNALIEKCIASWKQQCPSYSILEWNEETFDVNSHPFTKRMYAEKKYAFVADYVRLIALKDYGGVYLDTDMLLVKSLSPLLDTPLLLGKESDAFISCGMIGAKPAHPFIEAMRKEYDAMETPTTNPVIMTRLYKTLEPKDATILSPSTFYPFDADTIKEYKGQSLPDAVYGVHLWNYSWGSPLNKAFKKIGIYRIGKKMLEMLGIKKIIKKILGFI